VCQYLCLPRALLQKQYPQQTFSIAGCLLEGGVELLQGEVL